MHTFDRLRKPIEDANQPFAYPNSLILFSQNPLCPCELRLSVPVTSPISTSFYFAPCMPQCDLLRPKHCNHLFDIANSCFSIFCCLLFFFDLLNVLHMFLKEVGNGLRSGIYGFDWRLQFGLVWGQENCSATCASSGLSFRWELVRVYTLSEE